MCGIIGAVATENIIPLLINGLKRLEYRGYDSSGIAVLTGQSYQLVRHRSVGKVNALKSLISKKTVMGNIGIAHTRWATHGKPSNQNAHPHICNERVGIVHNGIIENYLSLKSSQLKQGYCFTSDTDTEVIVHAIDGQLQQGKTLLNATRLACGSLQGTYALGVVSSQYHDQLIATCNGSPLVVGLLKDKAMIASDINALLDLTQKFIILEDGDIAQITLGNINIYDKNNQKVERKITQSNLTAGSVDLNGHSHYMHKEIFEQPSAIIDTLEGRCSQQEISINAFGHQANNIFKQINQVQIIACGTSYHAGLVAKYWFEDIIQLTCNVEVASEYRYRHPVINDKTLLITLSQSGETADTVEALKSTKLFAQEQQATLWTLAICNTPESRLTRLSDLTFLMHAGPEIGVASTKAFSTQLVCLALLMCALGKSQNKLSPERECKITQGLHKLPGLIQSSLKQEKVIAKLAKKFANRHNALFLGRGVMYPIAMEGALKLKEVSYIHAEAYPAGELKHGPIALIDKQIPVVVVAPNNELLEKLKTNLQEVKARGSQMIVFEDIDAHVKPADGLSVVAITENVGPITAPIVFNIALQLLSYHVALILDTDVDKPRNLAKSVTVE